MKKAGKRALKVISGGQTGVDRAALDAALALGLPVGGWCPKGRRAEDGPIPPRYPLKETPSPDYAQRTAWNVRDADATLILKEGKLTGGTALTASLAQDMGKPLLIIDLGHPPPPETVAQWIAAHGIHILNVAGPRESQRPGIYAKARGYLERVFTSGDG